MSALRSGRFSSGGTCGSSWPPRSPRCWARAAVSWRPNARRPMPSRTMARYRRHRSGAIELVYADTELSISSIIGTSVGTKSWRRWPSFWARSTRRVTTGTMLFRARATRSRPYPLCRITSRRPRSSDCISVARSRNQTRPSHESSMASAFSARATTSWTACSKSASISSSLLGEAPVDGADPQPGVVGDVVERGVEAPLGEDLPRGHQDALTVAGRIGPQRPAPSGPASLMDPRLRASNDPGPCASCR